MKRIRAAAALLLLSGCVTRGPDGEASIEWGSGILFWLMITVAAIAGAWALGEAIRS